MRICIVGAGYVGLVSAACFAEMGHTVTCIETNAQRLQSLKNNIIPIYEPGLEELVKKNTEKKSLLFSNKLQEGLKNSEIVFIAVGTPQGEDGTADLSYVLGVAAEIGEKLENPIVVVNKSTVPVGTAELVKKIITEKLTERKQTSILFDVASNPEFLKEGDALNDFFRPDRIVIGVSNTKTETVLKNLYSNFVKNGNPIITMDIHSAEITKYASNAMLALRISFMNEVALLCDKVGADIEEVRKGIGSDKRIGMPFLYAGLGYGGSCFPKDVKALQKTMQNFDIEPHILSATDLVNKNQCTYFFEKINKFYTYDLKNKTFAVWGLSFKPKTDDVRESQSVALIKKLLQAGSSVKVHDPEALKYLQLMIEHPNISSAKDKYEVLKNSDALILATEWSEYRNPDFSLMSQELKNKVMFDGRNQFCPKNMRDLGWTYICVGRS